MKKQILLLILILSTATIIADDTLVLEIPEGKSNFTIQEYFPSFYASDLIQQNPEIQSISVEEYGQTYGYINTFGGIGTNLLIQPDKNYEIYSSETLTIKLN